MLWQNNHLFCHLQTVTVLVSVKWFTVTFPIPFPVSFQAPGHKQLIRRKKKVLFVNCDSVYKPSNGECLCHLFSFQQWNSFNEMLPITLWFNVFTDFFNYLLSCIILLHSHHPYKARWDTSGPRTTNVFCQHILITVNPIPEKTQMFNNNACLHNSSCRNYKVTWETNSLPTLLNSGSNQIAHFLRTSTTMN